MVSVAQVSVAMVSRSVVVGAVASMMSVVTVVSMEPVSIVTMGIGISFSLPLSVVMAVVPVVASVVAMPVGQGVSVPVPVEPIVSLSISLSNSAGFSLGLGRHGGKKAKGGDCDELHGEGSEQARGRSRTPM